MTSGGNNFNDFSENQLSKTSNLSQNPEESAIATNICFLTNFTELQITKILGGPYIVAHPFKILGGPWPTQPMLHRPPMSWWEGLSLCTPYPSPRTKPYESAAPSPKIPANHFRVIASYLWKVANFNLPQLHLASSLGWSRLSFAQIFGIRKLASLDYCAALLAWFYI